MSVLVLRDIPAGSQVGLDLHNWQTGPNFQGLRDVLDGIHCLHVTIKDVTTTKFAVWLDIGKNPVPAFRWDRKNAIMCRLEQSVEPQQVNPMLLVGFPAEVDHSWTALTSHICTDVISSILPLDNVLTSTTSSNIDASDENLPTLSGNSHDASTELTFCFPRIDLKRSWPVGAIGRDITEMSLDKSWLLQDVVRRLGADSALLGQFQVCFLCVLLFTSISAFDQWHVLLRLFCGSKLAICKHGKLYASFLAVLQAQLQQVSSDLYSDIFSLTVPRQVSLCLRSIAELSEDGSSQIPKEVRENLEVLQETLHQEFGADDLEHAQQQATYPIDDADHQSEDEDDDEAPVIVKL